MSTTLDPRYLPFINVSSQNYDPRAPRLALVMESCMGSPTDSAMLCITLPYMMMFTTVRASDDAHKRPITYMWSAWGSMAKGRFVLLHETGSGELEPIEVSMLGGLVDEMYGEDEAEVSASDSEVREGFPGQQSAPVAHLMANYQTKLVPGETYHLVWPGGEIELWEWGTRHELRSKSLKLRRRRDRGVDTPALMLPPAAGITFTAYEAKEPFPDREQYIEMSGPHASYDTANEIEQDWRDAQERLREGPPRLPEQPRVLTAERIEGAPVLSYEIVEAGPFRTVSKITYEASSNNRAITFHTWPFRGRHSCELYRLEEDGWRLVPDDPNIIAFYLMDPDDENDTLEVDVKVGGENNDFISLEAGESWVTEKSYTPWKQILKPGDKLKYVFEGTTLGWWDWGTKKDHINTVVTLPHYAMGNVKDPADNNGRPKVVVPASNEMEFVLGEELQER